MYRAIVIDDEPKVTRGLTKLIPQLDSDWTVVGQARNGFEGIQLVEREMPDLVITDIRMPRMNGLDMLISLGNYPIYIVILSGYGYFEYAQTAIKFGAFDFLLKPMKSEQILDVLTRIKEIKKIKTQQAHEPVLIEDYSMEWKEWLLDSPLTQTVPAKLGELILLDEKPVRIFLVEIDSLDELVTEDQWGDRKLVKFAVRNVLKDIMDSVTNTECTFIFQDGAQLLYLFKGDCSEKYVKRCASQMIDLVNQYIKLSISIGISNVFDHINNIPAFYRQAGEAIQNKWIQGLGSVCVYSELQMDDILSVGYPLYKEESIVIAIRHCQAAEAANHLKEFIALITSDPMTYRLFRRSYLQLSAAVIRVLYEYKIYDLVLKELPNIYDLLEENSSIEYMHSIMRELIHASIEAIGWTKMRKNRHISENAIQYIHDHYMKDISLDEVAGKVNMSSNYFSTFFKQEEGITFVEYLTRLRIDKAKTMMSNDQLRLYEISEMVGYQDVKYFSRVFKRNVGVTPVEYRSFFFRKEKG